MIGSGRGSLLENMTGPLSEVSAGSFEKALPPIAAIEASIRHSDVTLPSCCLLEILSSSLQLKDGQ